MVIFVYFASSAASSNILSHIDFKKRAEKAFF
jgi:hypothetical protein